MSPIFLRACVFLVTAATAFVVTKLLTKPKSATTDDGANLPQPVADTPQGLMDDPGSDPSSSSSSSGDIDRAPNPAGPVT